MINYEISLKSTNQYNTKIIVQTYIDQSLLVSSLCSVLFIVLFLTPAFIFYSLSHFVSGTKNAETVQGLG